MDIKGSLVKVVCANCVYVGELEYLTEGLLKLTNPVEFVFRASKGGVEIAGKKLESWITISGTFQMSQCIEGDQLYSGYVQIMSGIILASPGDIIPKRKIN